MTPILVVKFVLGGWDLGTHADLILQGVLFGQFAKYWSNNKRDYYPYKVFVICLCIATTVKSAHSIALIWFQNVVCFADFR
ncbi:hypothetical protein C8J57DRAFT_1507716 [Mycena rebaudengoi]|nr:hypothetical protein C8J57DRAFT_1507716 [Mycena rebaudengoi]